jgi:hypothetical protein
MELLISDLYYIDKSIDNINTNEFIDGKSTSNKKNYQHHSIGDYVIPPRDKTVCNSISDLFHIIDGQNPSVINILSVAFHVICFFNSLELCDGLSPSVILLVMCLIFFKKNILKKHTRNFF